MRLLGIPARLSLLLTFGTCFLELGQAHAEGGFAFFWAPPGRDTPATSVRASLSRALAVHHYTLTDTASGLPEPSLRDALAHAIASYRAVHVDEAHGELERITAEAIRTGGGDLDRRGLGELFLYLALVSQERGQNDLAWDAFVASARFDPTRVIDPAQIPPKGAAAHHRALAEIERAPRVDVSLHVPATAQVRVDGEDWTPEAGPLVLPGGVHYVQVRCDGFEPWRGAVSLSPPKAQLTPALRPLSPPTIDALGPTTTSIVLVAVYRSPEGAWRVAVRARSRSGRLTDVSEELGADADSRIASLVNVALDTSAPQAIALPTAPRRRPWSKRWWIWTIAGASVAAVAIGLGVGLTHGDGAKPGTVGGTLEPVR